MTGRLSSRQRDSPGRYSRALITEILTVNLKKFDLSALRWQRKGCDVLPRKRYATASRCAPDALHRNIRNIEIFPLRCTFLSNLTRALKKKLFHSDTLILLILCRSSCQRTGAIGSERASSSDA